MIRKSTFEYKVNDSDHIPDAKPSSSRNLQQLDFVKRISINKMKLNKSAVYKKTVSTSTSLNQLLECSNENLPNTDLFKCNERVLEILDSSINSIDERLPQ